MQKILMSQDGKIFKLPAKLLSEVSRYEVINEEKVESLRKKMQRTLGVPSSKVFSGLYNKYTEAGVYLKGLRLREGLSQIDFAALIGVTQGDLSKMENGKRVIGKKLAQQIGKRFKFNYRRLL